MPFGLLGVPGLPGLPFQLPKGLRRAGIPRFAKFGRRAQKVKFGRKPPGGKLGIQKVKSKNKTIKAWHATKKKHVKSFKKHGPQAGKEGRLGPAFYCTLRKKDAWKIAKSARMKGRGCVISVSIKTKGVIYNAGCKDSRGTTWKFPVGVVKGKHPVWKKAGMRHPFTEIAVRNPSKRVRITKIRGA